MKTNKKHAIAAAAATVILVFAMYWFFHDSWGDILVQIKNAGKQLLLVLFLLGNLYIVLDGMVFCYMIRRNHEPCSVLQAIRLSYMVVFFNVTTFAAGTKPAQIYYLYRQNHTAPGKGFGMLTMEYVSHKLTIVLYAMVMLCFYGSSILDQLGDSWIYLPAGFGISFVILIFLVTFCVTERFVPWLSRLSGRIKKEKWKAKAEKVLLQLEEFSKVGRVFAKDKRGWMELIVLNGLKMTCLYLIPMTAAYAVTKERLPLSVGGCIAYASVMQLLIGVIPTSGGTGSTELVFMLLFGRMLGKAACGAAMILYRMATYYVPFLVSIPLMATGRKKA